MSEDNINRFDRLLSVLAGFFAVATITSVAIAVDASTSEVPLYSNYARPFTLAAAGIGTGHYLGKSIKNRQKYQTHFALGFFFGIFIQSIYYTLDEVVGSIPYPAIVIISALFALIMHISPLLEHSRDMASIMEIFGGWITSIFLIYMSVTKFFLSLDPWNGFKIGYGILSAVILLIAFIIWAEEPDERQ
ncbi:hypothetical protein [Halosimplex halophilum]|uniref:hypothetical protein n=1 Tax=Halosimplex halophilum TaxID=2559572 RepID=UPI00107F9633|nr:hypothetical protein [Halosimplex halophilum]